MNVPLMTTDASIAWSISFQAVTRAVTSMAGFEAKRHWRNKKESAHVRVWMREREKVSE